jgi:hypothetical protein
MVAGGSAGPVLTIEDDVVIVTLVEWLFLLVNWSGVPVVMDGDDE